MAVFAGLWGPEVFETPDRILLQNHPFAVYNAGTNVLASIFTDRTKATPAPNPSATDAFGNGSFYADPDLYELEVNDFRVTVAVPMDPEEDEAGSVPPVTSVNTETGDVILSAADVGADVAGAAAAAQAFAIQRANHTGSQSADTLSDGATNKAFLATERTKLAGIEALADVTDAANVSAAGAVMKTGDETVNGIKTFPSSPIVPTPTTDFQAATKKYVDDNIGGGGGGNVSNANAPAAGEFAKFTSPTLIEGRTLSETRSDLGLVIGVNVQAWSTELDDLAAMPATGFGLSLLTLLNASELQDQAGISAFIKTLLDDADAATARTTLGAMGSDVSGALDTTQVFKARITGDAQPEFLITAGGRIGMGDGTSDPTDLLDWMVDGTAMTGDGNQVALGMKDNGDGFLAFYWDSAGVHQGIYGGGDDLWIGSGFDAWQGIPTPGDGWCGIRCEPASGFVQVYIEDVPIYNFDNSGIYFDRTASGTANERRISQRGDSLIPPIAKTASFTFALSESGCALECNHASVAIAATIPPAATVNFPIGTVLEVYRKGAAAVTIVEGAGVTIENIVGTTITITNQFGTVSLRKSANDTWVAAGGPYTVS